MQVDENDPLGMDARKDGQKNLQCLLLIQNPKFNETLLQI